MFIFIIFFSTVFYSQKLDAQFNDKQQLTGFALKQPVSVYEAANRDAPVLKQYPYGHLLKYRAYSKEWFQVTVYINGKRKTGFIHQSEVGQKAKASVKGIALKSKTNIYQKPSKTSKILKKYNSGQILKYRAYSKNWFIATVYVNNRTQTGYIHRNDVETITSSPVTLQTVGTKNKIRVHQIPSTSSRTLKTYPYGQILKVNTFSSSWYKVTVFVKGKKQTGYIYKKNTGPLNSNLTSYAYKNKTHIYSQPSKQSHSIKSYPIGTILKFRAYNNDWYKATVYVEGKKQSGYIYKKDIGINPPTIYGYAKKNLTVYKSTSRNAKKLKTYPSGSKIKFKPYNSSWYQATIFIKGKSVKGFIHKNDVTLYKITVADQLKTIDENNQLILVTTKGYNTYKATIRTFERTASGNWKQILSVPGYIGKNGFARNKKEGDGKSPAGKYTIGFAFGQKGNPGTKLPFRAITNDDVWVDDPESKLYNTWQSRKKASGQWKSAENMNNKLYRYGFVINYNQERIPYKGSAIFFHVANNYTLGCTGTSEKYVVSILKWLDPKKKPVIIQTPEQELNKY